MKKIYFLLFLFLETLCLNAQELELDTLYYDKNWKGVPNSFFADFYRIIEKNPSSNSPKKFRDFYVTGEIQGEGSYLKIDPTDDSKSIFDGECIGYFKSGNKDWIKHCNGGKEDGEFISFYENGNLKIRTTFFNGLVHGLYTQFDEKGLCYQFEYYLGEPQYDYYTVTNDDGLYGKFRISDNTPIFSSPSESDIKSEYRDGNAWLYYINDGICVSTTNIEVSDYGKYFRIYVNITNNSFVPITFDPIEVSATYIDKKGNVKEMEMQTAQEYDKRIKRTQMWEEALVGFASGLATSNAGYSTSTTNTYSSGYANSYGNVSAYGSDGYAYGSYSGTTNYYGSSTSTTTTYNPTVAYQAQMQASQQLASISESNFKTRQSRNDGYLKKTTIYPGESVSGYFNIKRKKGMSMTYILNINDSKYPFTWNIKK